jgi:catechol 2,3-dioxygenase-like lactoylglutathione lyase family enzyme
VAILRMDHVGVVVDDLPAATDFFVQLGFEPGGGGTVEGRGVESVVGLDGVRTEFAFVRTPDGSGNLELIKFHSPPHDGDEPPAPANALGIRHLAFVVDDIDAAVAGLELVGGVEDFGGSYRLCYVRGPEGIIVELAEKLTPARGSEPAGPA